MSGMFWIALELSMPKTGLNIMLSLTVKKLDAFKFDGVAESDNTDTHTGWSKSSPTNCNHTWGRVRGVIRGREPMSGNAPSRPCEYFS